MGSNPAAPTIYQSKINNLCLKKDRKISFQQILGRKLLPYLSFNINERCIAAQSCLPGEFGLNEGRINLNIYFLGNLIGVIR